MLPSVFQVIAMDRVNRVIIAPDMHDAIVFSEAHWGPLISVNFVGPLHGYIDMNAEEDSPSAAPEGTPLQ